MTAIRIKRSILPLGLAGAIAAALVASAGLSASADARPGADRTVEQAQAALAKGQVDKAIKLVETAAAANPREPKYRALLGQAYLKAGRFHSAVSAFNDAMKLGDNGARTALGLSLATVAAGQPRDAVSILDDWRDSIPASDLGLALALAGETSRGVAILADALRSGDNSPKLRQNLAYAYALDGRWREARLMMSQDVPADQLDGRISDWAMKAKPEDFRERVATLLGAPLDEVDPGLPARLALVDSPDTEQVAAEAAAVHEPAEVAVAEAPAPTAVAPAFAELPPANAPAAAPAPAADLADYAPVSAAAPAPVVEAPVAARPQQASFATTFATGLATQFVSQPIVQALPASYAIAAAWIAPQRAAPVRQSAPRVATRQAAVGGGTHLVQLGSFSSPQGARRAWGYYAAKNPELRGYRMTITPAVVRGKNFWRVAAAGFTGGTNATGMCSAVKSRGGVCFAYAASRGVPAGGKATAAPMMAQAKVAPAKGAAGPALARRR